MTDHAATAPARTSLRRSVDSFDPKGKRVFVRADFNVPADDAGAITDDRRIRGALPTIESIIARGGSVVVASHFGRPAGTGYEASESLQPVFERLRQLLAGKAEVLFAGQVPTDDAARAAVAALAEHLLRGLCQHFAFWVCGEDVARKKPDPEAYRLALQQLGYPASTALALEDSGNGLAAADSAGLACLLTLSHYGSAEPPQRFGRARAVVDQLGAGAAVLQGPACQGGQITLSYVQALLEDSPP